MVSCVYAEIISDNTDYNRNIMQDKQKVCLPWLAARVTPRDSNSFKRIIPLLGHFTCHLLISPEADCVVIVIIICYSGHLSAYHHHNPDPSNCPVCPCIPTVSVTIVNHINYVL